MAAIQRPNDKLRSARKLRGWSLDDVANQLQRVARCLGEPLPGADCNMVSRWERGVRSPSPRYVRLLCSVFELPADDLGLASRADPVHAPDGLVVQTLHSLGLDVERRDFLRHLTTLLGAAILSPILDPEISHAAHRSAQALGLSDGQPDVEDPGFVLKCITAQYRRLDDSVTAPDLLGPVQSHLRLTVDLFNHAAAGPEKARLAAAVSEVAGFTGWLWLDLNNSTVARQHYLLAVYGAQQAQDTMLTAYMIGSLASVATDEGQSSDALAMCAAVDDQLHLHSTATSLTWSAALRASALASVGDASTWRMLGEAERMVERSMDEGGHAWPWLSPFHPDKLAATHARCTLRLGQPGVAKEELSSILARQTISARQRGELLVDRASACLQVHEVDEACWALSDALDHAVRRQSRHLLHRIHLARNDLDQWRTSGAVRELDDRLHLTSA